jgi:hypothetical protein
VEARLRRDGVVVPDAQRAPAHSAFVVIVGERKVMTGVEPAVVGVAQRVELANIDHRACPFIWRHPLWASVPGGASVEGKIGIGIVSEIA